MVISEIGNYRLTLESVRVIHDWKKPRAERSAMPREKFYLDGIVMPMSEKTTGFTVDKKHPGIYPVIWTYHQVKNFSADQADEAIGFFRTLVNGGE